ncbi:MAG: hypothetical protein F6K65_42965 [Moorea sp. SIO3C2]|nr:hypothetical protein [Moorena sp. SIO3C2]
MLTEYGLIQRMFVSLRSQSLDYRQAILSQRHYQPAEQRVGPPHRSSDIYAIGMMALQSLTGQSPEWLVDAIGQRSLTQLVNADPNIVKLFARMVSPNQAERFSSATEVLSSLPLGLIPKPSAWGQQLA